MSRICSLFWLAKKTGVAERADPEDRGARLVSGRVALDIIPIKIHFMNFQMFISVTVQEFWIFYGSSHMRARWSARLSLVVCTLKKQAHLCTHSWRRCIWTPLATRCPPALLG